ncbi:MAG TPA: hypothetical protein VLE22_27510 [Bryobacteraceae bacterium]|nr:hypothetical protein [Bryobacteraceae bacterium]
MRRVSIRELHLNTGAIVKEASEGEVIVVEWSPDGGIASRLFDSAR